MPSYKDLGYNGLGIKTLISTQRESPQQLRNTIQSWAITSNSMYIGSNNDVVKADKEGLYVGDAKFSLAPFRVNMAGRATLTSASITATDTNVTPGTDVEDAFQINQADGTQIFKVDTTNGWVNIGPDQPLYDRDPQCSLYIVKDIDGYHSINLMNTSGGEFASADIGAVNDTTDPYGGYVDLGINGSGWADPDFAVFDAGVGYVFSADTDLYVGTGGSNLYFFVGGFDSKDYIKAEINSDGVFIPVQATEATEPPWVEGGIYYNTDKHKMYVGGEAGWEEVTATGGTKSVG